MKFSLAWCIEILDPVAGVAYVLNDKNKVAHRTYTQGTVPRRYAPLYANIENLGAKVIEGVLAEGTRTSTSALIIETWDSVELKVNMLTKSSNGYSTLRSWSISSGWILTPRSSGEQADYTIVDQ